MTTIIGALPDNLTNGTTADASQVMANFNTIVSDVNTNAVAQGANSTITSLSGLTTPLSVAQGGTGVDTLTAHAVLVGAGSSDVVTAGPGTSGQVLTSNGASSDPTFQSLPTNGTMASQDANDVDITGGTISGITLSSSTITGHASLDLEASNNLSDLGNLSTALTNLGFTTSAASDGYVKLPGGIIIQWGYVSSIASGSGTFISYPISFPNHAYSVTITSVNSGGGGTVDIGTPNTSGFEAYASVNGSAGYWMAIGN